ncbi:MAG: glycosyltransferase 87 family protein [Pyrinomonadaceae bacterium]
MKSVRAMLVGVAVKRANLLLVALGLASLVLYKFGLRAKGTSDIIWFVKLALAQMAIYLAAVGIVFRARCARSSLIIVIVFAALFRLSILFVPPYLSDDIYRYIWDGRVQAAGINPYRYVPADDALARLRDASIYPQINRRDYAHTIYPPVAQAVYFLATRISERVVWMKAVMVGFEVVGLWALMALLASFNLPRQRALALAWHPLFIWETAGSGHVEAVAVTFIVLALLARRRNLETLTGVALACATLVKLFPAVLFPALYKRWGWRMPLAFFATIIVSYVPYLSVGISGALGFLPGYTEEEGLQNGVRFYLLNLARWLFGENNVPNAAFIVFALVALASVGLWAVWKRERTGSDYIVRAFALAFVFTLILSPRYAWYFAWLIPFTSLLPLAPVLYMTTACYVLYASWLGDRPPQMFILSNLIYLPFALLCGFALWRREAETSDEQIGMEILKEQGS